MNNDPLGLGGNFIQGGMPGMQPRQAAPTKKKNKGFWLDQISTGGGIGGALGGAAAGAAAGSVVPILGTAAGGIIGALIGGGLGSGAGEIAENAITGDDLMQNVGKEALIGGATSLPIGAGLKLARAGLKAGTGIGKKAAGDLVQEAGAQVIPGAMKATTVQGVTKNRVGKNLEKISGQMLNSQTQVTGAQARKMGLKPVETMSKVNARTGLTNFDDMAEVSRTLTGAGDNSILDVLTREAVGSTSGVKVDDLRTAATKLLDDKGTLLTEAQRKDILRNVKNASTTMFGGSKGSLDTLANPQEALSQANKFRAAAQNIRTRSLTATPEQMDMAKVYDGLAKHIEDALYKSPGVNDAMTDLTRFGTNSLREMAGEARVAGNTAQADAYMKIADELSGLKDVQQLRKMKKDFVDIGKMDSVTAQADGARQFNAESASSMMKGSPIKGTLAAIMNAGMPRVAGQTARAGRALQGGTEVVGRSTQNIPMLAARQGGARLLTAPGASQDEQMAAMMPQDAQLPGMTGGEQMAPEPSIGGLTKSQLEEAMMMAAMDNNEDAFKQLQAIYGLLPEPTGANLSATALQNLTSMDSVNTSVDQLSSLYDQAGGGGGIQGTVAGVAGSLGLNDNARQYNDSIAALAREYGRAMGEGASGSNADAEAYLSKIPRLTDSPQLKAQKIAALKQQLAQRRQSLLTYGAGAPQQSAPLN